MFGVSVSYPYLRDGGSVCGEFAYGKGEVCPVPAFLASLGVSSAELRSVGASEDPETVLRIAEEFRKAGLAVTVHAKVGSAESAVRDVFDPLALLTEAIPNERQKKLTVTVHPVNGADLLAENVAMLSSLAEHILRNGLPVCVALENNRLLPDNGLGDSCVLVGKTVAAVRRALKLPDGEICRADLNPIVGTCFDMGHYAWYRKTVAPGEPYAPPDSVFLSYAVHTHIHGLNSDGQTHHPLTPGCGLPLCENALALGENYAGEYHLELIPKRFDGVMKPSEAVRASLRFLRENLPPSCKMFADLRAHFRERLSSSTSLLRDEKQPGTRFSTPLSTFYVFDTNGTKWVMDPALRSAGKITGTAAGMPALLRGAEYILITHRHPDHFDPDVVRACAGKGFCWVIPDFMVDRARQYGLSDAEMIVASAGKPLTLGNLSVLPFEGRHFRPGTRNGVPSLGYRISSPGAPTLLFPGDVRDFSVGVLPDFGTVDAVFAHVWLGDGNCMETDFPLTGDFVRFYASFGAKKIILAHLYESGRLDPFLWRREHAERLRDVFAARSPDTGVLIPAYGETIRL